MEGSESLVELGFSVSWVGLGLLWPDLRHVGDGRVIWMESDLARVSSCCPDGRWFLLGESICFLPHWWHSAEKGSLAEESWWYLLSSKFVSRMPRAASAIY